MLEAVPNNIFSSTFRLEEEGRLLGEVKASLWRGNWAPRFTENIFYCRAATARGAICPMRSNTRAPK